MYYNLIITVIREEEGYGAPISHNRPSKLGVVGSQRESVFSKREKKQRGNKWMI